jgi:mycoredoxin
MYKIEVYGADWCGDTKRTLKYLDGVGANYKYINVEEDAQASQWVKDQNSGKERKPTIKLGDEVLSVPSDAELETALRRKGIVR